MAIGKYERQVDDEITTNSNRLNDIMTLMSLFSVSFVPASVLTGIFGMNVRIPYSTDVYDHKGPFYTICSFIAMFASSIFLASYCYLKKKK